MAHAVRNGPRHAAKTGKGKHPACPAVVDRRVGPGAGAPSDCPTRHERRPASSAFTYGGARGRRKIQSSTKVISSAGFLYFFLAMYDLVSSTIFCVILNWYLR